MTKRRLLQQAAANPAKLKSMRRWEDVPIQLLEEMLLVSAEIVDRRGEAGLPLLKRIENEYIAAKSRGKAVDRIRKLIASD